MNGRRFYWRTNVLEASLAAALFVVGLVFTFFPATLDHSPVGFENRGAIHHVWHYLLLFGSLSLLVGVLRPDVRAELVGLALTLSMATINLTALLLDALGEPSEVTRAVSGYGIGLRAGLVVGLTLRIRVLTTQLNVKRRLEAIDDG